MAGKSEKLVYFFGEGDTKDKFLLGGKGANLGEMTKIGLPVPPGFTITTHVCMEAIRTGNWPAGLSGQVDANIERLEKAMKKRFGDNDNPLLVSVRSGSAFSMPGMMDTILNLGMNDKAVQGLAKSTGNERFAWDAYRRFLQMFGNVVLGLEHHDFEHVLNEKKKGRMDTDLSASELRDIVSSYKALIRKKKGRDFPQEPREQLKLSIDAVFKSWNNDRAITYRRLNNIRHDIGTAVNVQSMVFGNMGNDSGTGVAFTRDPATGEDKFYGEYLMNAQGEDVVAGIRTPHPISDLQKDDKKTYTQLVGIREKLEKHYRDMQDIEFTIERGRLFMLQTRNGKRTARSAVKIAVDMVKEGLITKEEALLRIEPASLDQLLHPMFDQKALKSAKPIAKGLNAGPGAAVGKVAFSAKDAEDMAAKGDKVILVRIETSPDDIKGMHVAQGVLTSLGGRTSHAAVVARQMGKCCVAGAGDVRISYEKKVFVAGGVTVKGGDVISLDGTEGFVYTGSIPTVDAEMSGDFGTIMKWSDEARTLGVQTNAQSPKDAQVAVKFGAEGIGLARTERMFYDGDRITSMRKMIMAESLQQRKAALNELLPHQRGDFEGLFMALNGKPVTIRLIDPPLHEFLPTEEHEMQHMAQAIGVSVEKARAKVDELKEFNPMLGHRGVRLLITNPEIAEMQVRA
ncbi:MAG: pyruvate, phosphate dikinase, partial [Candidatus Aenigmatarchaeota archaeon]